MITSLSAETNQIQTPTNETIVGLNEFEQPSSHPPLHLVTPEGQLKVHSAPFRGSFPGVLSEALRAAGLGSHVMVAQFLKGGVGQGPKGIVKLCGKLEWLRPDMPFCIKEESFEKNTNKELNNYSDSVKEIWQICKERLIKGSLDQLVLDEVGLAISLGYLEESELISTLEQKPNSMDVILTGPSIPSSLMAMADQVTVLRCGF